MKSCGGSTQNTFGIRRLSKELLYLRLMPKKIDAFTEGIRYDSLTGRHSITIDVPPGDHVLIVSSN